jgi:FMN phosphatase YigB (HAD superfamily)
VLRAVLFDWGDTLFHFAYDEELLASGWEAGLATLEREGLPGHDETAAVFRERYLPLLFVEGSVEEVEYPELIRGLLGGFGVELTDDELDRFLAAEHAAWARARVLGN